MTKFVGAHIDVILAKARQNPAWTIEITPHCVDFFSESGYPFRLHLDDAQIITEVSRPTELMARYDRIADEVIDREDTVWPDLVSRDDLPVRSGYGFWKRLRLSLCSGAQYGWRARSVRGGVMQFRGEMFRLQTDYFPCLNGYGL